jgi:hypothetical protein
MDRKKIGDDAEQMLHGLCKECNVKIRNQKYNIFNPQETYHKVVSVLCVKCRRKFNSRVRQ